MPAQTRLSSLTQAVRESKTLVQNLLAMLKEPLLFFRNKLRKSNDRRPNCLGLLSGFILGIAGSASGQTITWTNATANGFWDLTSSNWLTAGSPSTWSNGGTALFDNTVPAATVSLNSPITVSGITFNTSGWTIAATATNKLTFNNGSVLNAAVTGTNTISGPVILNGSLGVAQSVSGAKVNLSGAITVAGSTSLDFSPAVSSSQTPILGLTGGSTGIAGTGTLSILDSAYSGSGSANTVIVPALSGAASAFTGTVNVGSGVKFNGSNVIKTAGSTIAISSGGQMVLPSAQYNGAITINGNGWNGESTSLMYGALRLGTSGGSYSSAITLGSDAAIGANNITTATLSGNITGSHQLSILWNSDTSTGTTYTLTLSGNNSYGSTYVNSIARVGDGIRVVKAGSATAFSSGAMTIDNGIVMLNGFNYAFANLSSSSASATGGVLQNGSAATAMSVTLGSDNADKSYYGSIIDGSSASLALNKTGTGTLTLAGANTYSGGTTITAGTLQIGAGGTTGSIAGDITNNGTLAFNRSNAYAYSNTISGAGSVVKKGSGALSLSGNNSYSGVTTVNGGTLSIGSIANGGSASSIGQSSSSAANLVLDGGSLQYTGAGQSSNRLFSIGTNNGTIDSSGGGAVNFTNTGTMGFNGQTGARTLTLSGSNTGSNTLSASIGNNGGATALVKSGSGAWILNGSNTYTGSTTVGGGTLIIGGAGAISSSTSISVANSAALDVSAVPSGYTIGSGQTMTNNGTVNGALKVSGLLGGTGVSGAVTVNGGGKLVVNSATLTTGNLSVLSAGELALTIDTSAVTAGKVTTGNFSLDLGNASNLTITDIGGNLSMADGTTFTIVDYAGSVWNGGLFTFNGNVVADDGLIASGTNTFQVSYNGLDGLTPSLTLSVVPEPAPWAMVLAGLGLLVGLRRRSRLN